MVIAGGDGSLVGAVTGAREAGVDTRHVPVCVLPYGTGNDLARVTNWGGQPVGRMYQSLRSLMTEICINSREEKLNVWTVRTTFKQGGDTLVWNAGANRLQPLKMEVFERDMINYFGIGEDGRIGMGFEMNRTSSRCCNKAVYGLIGGCYFFCPCCCSRGLTITEQIEYMRTLKKPKKHQHKNEDTQDHSNLIVEEIKEPLLVKENLSSSNLSLIKSQEDTGKIIFSTRKKDKEHNYINGNPISFVAPNISSYAGGSSNLWHNSYNSTGLKNPYRKKDTGKHKETVQKMQTSH